MARKLTNLEFISKIEAIYGDSLDYSKVDYKSSREYVTLICPIHGEFLQYANNVLQGRGGCPKCKNGMASLEEFILLAVEVHGNKYDYSKVEFKNMSTEVIIICPIHGEFKQTPRHHVKDKTGCAKCYHESRIIHPKIIPLTNEEKAVKRADDWKIRVTKIWNNKYDYSKVSEIYNLKDKVTIICPVHGEFLQSAANHLIYGCNKCGIETRAKLNMLSQEEFEDRANKIYHNLYKYGEYKGMHTKMEIICPHHGVFYCEPSNHLIDCGCPKCSESTGELIVRKCLESLNVNFKSLYPIVLEKPVHGIKKFVLDFVIQIDDRKYIIEYNGRQHYEWVKHFLKSEEDFKKQQVRDAVLRKICELKNINLLEISYLEKLPDIENIIKEFLGL